MPEIRLRALEESSTSEDSWQIWHWRNDAFTRAMSLATDPISWSDHLRWYETSLKNPKRHLWMIEAHTLEGWAARGVVRLDIDQEAGAQTHAEPTAYLSLNIAPSFRHQGLGRASLIKSGFLAFSKMGLKRIEALIKTINESSIYLFTSIGFVQVDDPNLPTGVRRYRWTLTAHCFPENATEESLQDDCCL